MNLLKNSPKAVRYKSTDVHSPKLYTSVNRTLWNGCYHHIIGRSMHTAQSGSNWSKSQCKEEPPWKSSTFKFLASPQDKDNYTLTNIKVSKGQNIYKYSTENLPPYVMTLQDLMPLGNTFMNGICALFNKLSLVEIECPSMAHTALEFTILLSQPYKWKDDSQVLPNSKEDGMPCFAM